jgi:hypothetical protein
MARGDRSNLERLLRSAWERQHRTETLAIASVARHFPRELRLLLAGAALSAAVGVVITLIATNGSVAKWGIVLLVVFGIAFFCGAFVGLGWIRGKVKPALLIGLTCVLMCGLGYLEWPPDLPWCYGFFYRGFPAVEGDILHFAVANPTKRAADGVSVNIVYHTEPGSSSLQQDVEKFKIERQSVFFPVVYPVDPGQTYELSGLIYEYPAPSDFYTISLQPENGEAVEESAFIVGLRECLTVTRLRDKKVIMENMSAHFDFDGRYKAVWDPCQPSNYIKPQSYAAESAISAVKSLYSRFREVISFSSVSRKR